MDGAAMYRALADRADGEQREIFLELARAEERHPAHWAAKLADLGEPETGPDGRPRPPRWPPGVAGRGDPEPRPEEHRRGLRARMVAWLARRFGIRAVLPLVERAETVAASHYDGVADART